MLDVFVLLKIINLQGICLWIALANFPKHFPHKNLFLWIILHCLHCMFLIYLEKQSFVHESSLNGLSLCLWTSLKEPIVCESDKSIYYIGRLILVDYTEWVMAPQPVKVSNQILKQMQIDKKWHILNEFPSEYAKTVHGWKHTAA